MSQPDQQPTASSASAVGGSDPHDSVSIAPGDPGRNGRSASQHGTTRKPAVVFSDVRTTFASETVLDGVSFEVVDREFVCLLGPSGCGKSTTLRIAGNLLTSYTGTVRVAGLEPAKAWPKLAYVFQSPRLVPWRTALSNVMLGMELRDRRLGKREIRRRALEALALVGLEKDVDKYPAILSGGERQRVSVARALAVDPDIILMDEPFAALDAMTKNHMRDEIIRIWEETKKAIMFVTHDVDEALHLADKLVVFSNKPTSILEEFIFTLPRPRNIEADPELRLVKQRIFERLGVRGPGEVGEE